MQDIGYRPLSDGGDLHLGEQHQQQQQHQHQQQQQRNSRLGQGKDASGGAAYAKGLGKAGGSRGRDDDEAAAAAAAAAAEEGYLGTLAPPCASGGGCVAPGACCNPCAPAKKMSVREALLLSPYDKWRLYVMLLLVLLLVLLLLSLTPPPHTPHPFFSCRRFGRFPWKLFFHLLLMIL